MYDVIVIGARCAGASTALQLARKGHRVLMVDRATFPSDIPHGHFIHQEGPSRLKRWGLLQHIEASGCPGVDSVTTHIGDFMLESTGVSLDGMGMGYGPRRKVLDQILIDAAVSAGAELREGCTVEGFVLEDDRIAGIRARDASGNVFTERATVTVGADGRNSRLARFVKAPTYEDAPTLLVLFLLLLEWHGPAGPAHVRAAEPGDVWFPHERFAVRGVHRSAHRGGLADEGRHGRALHGNGGTGAEFYERLRAGRREERFYGAADLPNFFRKPHGAGWALVGDAGHHKDPWMALGVNDALRDAEYLADALDDAFSGRDTLEGALPRYEQRRNESTMRAYRENLNAATHMKPPNESYQMRAALRGNPEDTRHFFRAYFGVVPRESFFNSENIQRVVQAAGARG